MGYGALAPVYDRLNRDVDYSAWADYMETCFRLYMEKKPELVLDLACGTGAMTFELARRGYDMTAVDISEEMLAEAEAKARALGIRDILFLQGDMTDFELYGTVQAVVCTLDGVNHLTSREELDACLALVSNYLEPGGVFLFDLNTPAKFRTVYADRDYILEDDGAVCCWRNRLNKKGDAVDFFLTVFEEQENGLWKRTDDVTRERAWGLRAIRNALERAGLDLLSVSSDYQMTPPDERTERWYIAAGKK
ncbi:MAG: class I SAM-dependent methyltransferase [Ruminococcaceae bacterium]|jgi:SAM-dependent methyltransferase|nr:class I SAM-dependent methyltransferase [Oscillospiraceae bacterium]